MGSSPYFRGLCLNSKPRHGSRDPIEEQAAWRSAFVIETYIELGALGLLAYMPPGGQPSFKCPAPILQIVLQVPEIAHENGAL